MARVEIALRGQRAYVAPLSRERASVPWRRVGITAVRWRVLVSSVAPSKVLALWQGEAGQRTGASEGRGSTAQGAAMGALTKTSVASGTSLSTTRTLTSSGSPPRRAIRRWFSVAAMSPTPQNWGRRKHWLFGQRWAPPREQLRPCSDLAT